MAGGAKRARIPQGVWALGLVSLLMDASSELIHSLLPVFLVSTLGAGASALGLIEGIAEATAAIAKVLSGALSDRWARRKPLVVAGYGLAALSKPLFPLAGSAAWVLAARFIDRIGKGVRGAPRDALIADIAPPAVRGASYGLRQALDTVGAFAGPLIALAGMALFAGDVRRVFWIAVIPAALAVIVLWTLVREPARPQRAERRDKADRVSLRLAELGDFPAVFWIVLGVGVLLALARFSEAFLLLRANDVGLGAGLVPLALVVMNVAYAASSYPAGALSDRMGRRGILALGVALLIAADTALALAGGLGAVALGVALWGLHMGLSQGLVAALVADAAPLARRGAAFGLYNLASGLALFVASAMAGLLWDRVGPAATFTIGGAVAAATLASLAALPRSPESNDPG